MFSLPLMAQDAVDQETSAPVPSLHTQELTPVRLKKKFIPGYPEGARQEGEEGWVKLGFMVSTAGTPYEIYIVESSGNRVLEQTALKAMESWTFEPAQVNGQAVDSAVSVRMNFALNAGQGLAGARPEFISDYRSLQKALDSHDRAASDKELKRLRITTIYEDAFYGFAQYRYAVQWGSQEQQIAGLRRAIADEIQPRLLPKSMFETSLRTLLLLEVKTNDYADAVSTWNRLRNVETDQTKLADLTPMMAKVQNLRNDETVYKVNGEITESSWDFRLYKKRFQVKVLSGHLSQVKLRCDKKFVTFPFDAELQYRVADGYASSL